MSLFKQIFSIYGDQDFRSIFDQKTYDLNRKTTWLVATIVLVFSSLTFFLRSLDFFGYLNESVVLFSGSYLIIFFARWVKPSNIQAWYAFGFICVACSVEIISISTNGKIYIDRPIHPGVFHLFFVLSAGRLGLKSAIVFSTLFSTALIGFSLSLGISSYFLPNFIGCIIFANIFGLLVNSLIYVEEWRVHQSKLSLSAEREKADNILANILPPEISFDLRLSRAKPVFYERDHVSVLVMDLVGYSEWVQSNEDHIIVDTLNELYREFDAVIAAKGAKKIKTLGDAYIVVSGLFSDQKIEQKCYDTAVALEEVIRQFNAKHGTRLQSRIGIATGAAIFGVIGHNRPKFDIWGPTLTMAQELEKSSCTNEISICDKTCQGLAA